MKAGIDFGTTLVKAAWKTNGEFKFSSTADTPLEDIIDQLKGDGVTQVNFTGIGYADVKDDYLKGFETKTLNGDEIQREIELQADGTRRLLRKDGFQGDDFLVVSIGTGTSYALVTKDKVTKFIYGNPVAGGSINGLGQHAGASNYNELAELSIKSKPVDLYIKDMIPETEGTLKGDLVIAHFGKATKDSDKSSIFASAIETVAVLTSRDINMFELMPDFLPPKDIVYIGSTVALTPALKTSLKRWSMLIPDKTLHFPEHGEFALAIGAYHMQE